MNLVALNTTSYRRLGYCLQRVAALVPRQEIREKIVVAVLITCHQQREGNGKKVWRRERVGLEPRKLDIPRIPPPGPTERGWETGLWTSQGTQANS